MLTVPCSAGCTDFARTNMTSYLGFGQMLTFLTGLGKGGYSTQEEHLKATIMFLNINIY